MQPGVTQRGRAFISVAFLSLTLSSNHHLTLRTDTFGTEPCVCLGITWPVVTEAGLHLIKTISAGLTERLRTM